MKDKGSIVYDSKGDAKKDKNLVSKDRVPLDRQVEEYFDAKIKPFNPESWVEESANKIGYEIAFMKEFYSYSKFRDISSIEIELKNLESELKKLNDELYWTKPIRYFSFPNDWEKQKFYNLFTPVKETSEKYSLEKVLSLTQNGIIEKDIQSNKGQMASSYEKYIKVNWRYSIQPYGFIKWMGRCCFNTRLISPSYLSFRPNKDKVNSTFIAFIFKLFM